MKAEHPANGDELQQEMYVLEQCLRLLGQLPANSHMRVLLYLARRYNINFPPANPWYAVSGGALAAEPVVVKTNDGGNG